MIQSNEKEEYELILGQNGQKEYLVKILREPYCRCKWVSRETILNSPNGEELITRYVHSANHKTNPPFYDENYDIPDRIIQKKENLFLVKWTHLFYDQLTWEKKIDKHFVSLFRARKSSKFPKTRLSSNNIQFDNALFPVKKFALYQDINASSDVVEEIQYLLTELQRNDATISEADYNYSSILSTSAFIHYLYRKMNDSGPYLVVVDKREFNDWYDFLNKSKELTTLSYNGTVQSRKTIREIDFISDDNSTLQFHILITIPHILEADIDYLQQIEWKFSFFHYSSDANLNSVTNFLKFFQKLKILRKVIYQPIDQKTIIPKAQAIAMAFESSLLKETLNTKPCEDFIQFIQKSKISTSNKVESTYFYVVECPMNDTQKNVCRNILYENISLHDPEKSNFFIIARLFYYVIQHPFIIPGVESKLSHESVLMASTKMRVMRRIIYEAQLDIEETKKVQNILICTQIPEMFRIINDFISETYQEECHIRVFLETNSKQIHNLGSNINLSASSSVSNLNASIQYTFKSIDIMIIFDGKLQHWRNLLDSKLTQSSRIYKLESLESREIEIGQSPSPTDQDICKTIALQIMIPAGKISPRELLEDNISFDMIKNDPHSSSFAVNSFTGEDFWKKFVNTSEFSKFKNILNSDKQKTKSELKDDLNSNASTDSNSNSNAKKKNQKNLKNQKSQKNQNHQNISNNENQLNMAPISLYQRRQFVRSLISFGFGNWSNIINSIGFEINEEICKKLCLTVLMLIKYEKEKNKYKKDKKTQTEKKVILESNFVANIYRDYMLQTKTDNTAVPKASSLNPNNFKEQLRNDKSFLTEELPFDFFERLFQIGCLCHFFESKLYDESDISNFDLTQFESSKPESWWTEEHDKALLYGTWKYGYGNYISFLMNDPPEKSNSKPNYHNDYKNLLREIAISNVNYNKMNKRELELLSFITSYIMNDLRKKNNNLLKTLPNWSNEEQETVISYVLSRGINFNSTKEINEIAFKMVNNGDENDEKVAEDGNKVENENENENETNQKQEEEEEEKENIFKFYQVPNKTKDAVADLLQLIKREISHPNPEEGGLSVFTAVRLRIRISSMKFLHNYILHVNEKRLFYFYTPMPKLKIGNYNISNELEHLFLVEIEKKGFGDFQSILSGHSFSHLTDIQVLSYMKDEYRVMLRLYVFSQIAIKKELFSKDNSSGDDFERMFGLSLPLSITSSNIVHNFGKIVPDKPLFHCERYIYPVGFKTSRLSPSITNPGAKARWFSEIADVDDQPLFRVWQDGSEDLVFEGSTTGAAWTKALKTSKHDNNVSISGPDSFLLTNPVVAYFVQKMPGASECKGYIMKDLDNNPMVIQFLKTKSLLASNDEEGNESTT